MSHEAAYETLILVWTHKYILAVILVGNEMELNASLITHAA